MTSAHLDIPTCARCCATPRPAFIEGTLVPLVLFMVGLHVLGVWGAMIAGLVWVYGAILVRRRCAGRVPGILLLGALTLTARTVIALASHSVVVYFLQPSLGTMLVAGAFLLSVPLDKPLAGRLAPTSARCPTRCTPTRTCAGSSGRSRCCGRSRRPRNAAITIWLLFSQSLGDLRRAAQRRVDGRHGRRDRRVGAVVQAQHARNGITVSSCLAWRRAAVVGEPVPARTLTTVDGLDARRPPPARRRARRAPAS